MQTIQANSLNELQKLLSKKITKLFLAGTLLIPFFTKLLVSKLFITNWMALPAENINFTLLDLFITILLPLFIFIAATDLFTREAEQGTLFPVRPISRLELFLSKTAAIGVLIFIQLLALWVSVMISSGFFDQTFDYTSLLSSLGAFTLSWVPLMIITALAVMIAQIVRSSALSISSMIVLYLFMLFIPYILPNLLYLLPTTYLDWYMQWLGQVSVRQIIQTITYLASSFALFMTISYYMFSRKEA